MWKRRAGVLIVLLASVAGVPGCRRSPEQPPASEIIARHSGCGNAQLENVTAVLEQAVALPGPTVEGLLAMDRTLAVNDLTWGCGLEAGNTRVLLLDRVFQETAEVLEALGIASLMESYRALEVPEHPYRFEAAFGIGDGQLLLTCCARWLRTPGPWDHPMQSYETPMLEEFCALKYLVILRPVVIVEPRHVRGNEYSPGQYAAVALVFDLARREQIDSLPLFGSNDRVMLSNASIDLGDNVRVQLEDLLNRRQGE